MTEKEQVFNLILKAGGKDPQLPEEIGELYDIVAIDKDVRRFVCVECFSQFDTSSKLQKHVNKKRHKFIIKSQRAFLDEKEKKEKMKRDEEKAKMKEFECDVCGSQLKNKYALNQHKNIHNKKKRIPCTYPDCSKTFARKNQMENHAKSRYHIKKTEKNEEIPKDKDRVKCTQCEKEFSNKQNMMAHVKRKHEGLTFACEKCNKKYKSNDARRKHVNAEHEKLKPYECTTCFTRFPYVQGLLTHYKSKKHDANIRVSRCPKCKTDFTDAKKHVQHAQTVCFKNEIEQFPFE